MANRRETKTRVRTGCLTCRARRIKCDEAKPECHRCHASNVECRGYDEKRRIVTERSRSLSTTRLEQEAVNDLIRAESTESPAPNSALRQPDSLPLVGLPSNPLPHQRPHDGARQILAYHQYIFRTVSIIAPPRHLWWWRDHLCQKAWELEYLYDAIIALGTIHRAVVLLSGPAQTSQRHGRDTAVVAMRTYTKALEQLASFLEQNNADTISIAVVLLLAYFECFTGNVSATYRHVGVASNYLASLSSTQTSVERIPLRSCLKALSSICQIAVPLIYLGPDMDLTASDVNLPAPDTPSSCTIHLCAQCPCQKLSEVLNLGSISPDIAKLIWNPLGALDTSIPLERIYGIQDQIKDWMRRQSHGVPQLCPDENDLDNTMIGLDQLPIPPEPHTTTSLDISLADYANIGALCEFYLARLEWALCFVTDDSLRHEVLVYSHCHRAMAWVETASRSLQSGASEKSNCFACERLNGGFISMLHIMGQMSPRTEWLRWIIGQMKLIGQEGLINGRALAESLGALPFFEMRNNTDISSLLDRFPSPTARSLCVMVPDRQSGGHVAYYARPASNDMRQEEHNGIRYFLLGSARWAPNTGGADSKAQFSFYDQSRENDVFLDGEWFQSEEVARGWYQNESWNFSFDLALADHRNSGLLKQISNNVNI